MKQKKNFQQTNHQIHEILTTPVKSLVLIGVFTLSLLSILWLEDWGKNFSFSSSKNNPAPGVVMGESISDEQALSWQVEIGYQNQLHSLLDDYFQSRSIYQNNNQIQDWLAANRRVADSILKLGVPKDYQKVHLEVIVAMDQESDILKSFNSHRDEISDIDQRWQQILDVYKWLD